MFTKILLASDGSDGAAKAAAAAAELTRRFGAELTVLHVFSPPAPAIVPFSMGELATDVDPTWIDRLARAAGEQVACRAGEVLQAAGVPYAFRMEPGHPAEVIVRLAETDGFDLVVLGSRGLGGVKEFLLGSVSNRVSHHARCPVLIVH